MHSRAEAYWKVKMCRQESLQIDSRDSYRATKQTATSALVTVCSWLATDWAVLREAHSSQPRSISRYLARFRASSRLDALKQRCRCGRDSPCAIRALPRAGHLRDSSSCAAFGSIVTGRDSVCLPVSTGAPSPLETPSPVSELASEGSGVDTSRTWKSSVALLSAVPVSSSSCDLDRLRASDCSTRRCVPACHH